MEFEKCLCRKLDSKAREDLVRICNRYLSNLASDRSWQTYGDVLALTAKLNRAAMALWNVAYEGGFSTDAQAELKTIFADQMSYQPVKLYPQRGDLLYLRRINSALILLCSASLC